MPIWRLRKSSFARSVAAYRSQWKRSLARLLIPGYGKRGRGIWRDPKRANYNFWYHRKTIGMQPIWRSKSHTTRLLATFVIGIGTLLNIITLPVDVAKTAIVASKVAKTRNARAERSYTNTNSSTKSSTAHSAHSRAQTTRVPGSQSKSNYSPAPRQSSYPSVPRTPSEPSYFEREADMKPAAPRAEQPVSRPVVHTAPSAVRSAPPMATSTKKEEPRPSVPTITTEAATATFEPLVKPVAPRKEDDPKSTPKHEKDQYIRKRMMICDITPEAESLHVGDYLDIVSAPTPEDKGAIALRASSGIVGYLSRTDCAPYVACLKLGRRVYAVVSEITHNDGQNVYDIETWYDIGE